MQILLLLFLLSALLQKPSNSLYCGIFAWTGDSHKKFNWDKFNILGIYNNTRGGDSCGRASGNFSEYGMYKVSDYHNFILQNNNFPIKENMIIGHDRKASVGSITEENAQPIVIMEGDEVVFIMAHNGTIYNIDNLKDKYKIHGFGRSDSYILARIIHENGFDVLKEYQGAAALIIYDRQKFLETGDTYIYAFKGKSKMYKGAVNSVEERPLFLFSKGNNSVYFSSMEDALLAMGGTDIFNIPSNIVLTFINGLYRADLDIEVDRTNGYQVKVEAESQYAYKSPFKMYPSRYQEDCGYNGYGADDDFYDSRIASAVNSTSKVESSLIDIEGEYISNIYNSIEYKRGMYYLNNDLADGIISLTKEGKVCVSRATEKAFPFYFIRGVMLKDHAEYHKTCKWIKLITNLKPGSDEFKRTILTDSVYPLFINNGATNGSCFYSMYSHQRHLYNGWLKPFFSQYKYFVKNGIAEQKEFLLANERTIPKLFEEAVNKDVKTKTIETDLDMIEAEAASIMAEVLESISKARVSLGVLGSCDMVDKLVYNLNIIEDELFIDEKGSLYKFNLKLNPVWEKPF